MTRKPLTGVANVIRFNWHYFVIPALTAIACVAGLFLSAGSVKTYCLIMLPVAAIPTFVSLMATWYIYDASPLYKLNWLPRLRVDEGGVMVNFTAGFDEWSHLLAIRFPSADLQVIDFFDPARHTEVSLRRARRRYPPYPGTKQFSTSDQLPSCSIDTAVLMFAAHEIREAKERIGFFRCLNAALKNNGEILVVEHQRDVWNFLAYTIGFFHFHSSRTWNSSFHAAGLKVKRKFRITVFVTCYLLVKHGNAS